MTTTKQIFTYTAKRKSFLTTFAAFAFSIIVETGLTTLVIAAITRNEFVRMVILFVSIGLCVLLAFMLLHPLLTKHRLTATHLELRYGSLRLDVPRDAILSATPAHERLNPFQPFKAQVDKKRRQLLAAFSENGQVLLTLNRPLPVRIERSTSRINRILLNVDRPESFFAALDTSNSVTQQSQAPVTAPSMNSL